MLTLYRSLLYLYPAAYREEYGQEMMAVLSLVQADLQKKGCVARAMPCAREITGLLGGAFQEHLRTLLGYYGCSPFRRRRLTMHSEFRFPKATVTLMAIILVVIVLAIEKARAIQASIPLANPHVGPIHPAEFTVFSQLLITLLGAGLAGAIGWAILFALHRSGVHRLSELDPSRGQRSTPK